MASSCVCWYGSRERKEDEVGLVLEERKASKAVVPVFR